MKIKSYERKAHYYETDQMGMIHHANYVHWLEEARIDYLEQVGMGYKSMEEAGVYSPVLSISCRYKHMVHFDDVIRVQMRLAEYNGIKYKISYRITDVKTGQVRALAETEHCFLTAQGRPMNLKKSHPEFDVVMESLMGVESGQEDEADGADAAR